MARVLFVTYGSLGDTLPFVAIAEVLRARGVTCDFVTNTRNADAVRARGFQCLSLTTDASVLYERAGYDAEAAVKATRDNVDIFWKLVMPEYGGYCAELEAHAAGADVIVSTPWAFNAQSVAEKTGTAYVGAHLWPLGLMLPHDPPVVPQLPILVKAPTSQLAIWWNALLVKAAHAKMRYAYARILNAPRLECGLPPLSRTPVLNFLTQPIAEMALYSPSFASATPHERSVTMTGFPVPKTDAANEDAELTAILQDEPIVFSLGSILSQTPGQFYVQSVAAARAVGRKALLLTQDTHGIPHGSDVLVRGFVPHGDVFPHASVIVHHGGIGTTGQALMAGKPQLVVPHFGDQPDNAARLVRLGVARSLSSTKYSDQSAGRALKELLGSPSFAITARDLADQIHREDGAATGADVIERVLAEQHSPN
ncbi:glycosyltransferase [Shimia ponticola]|uniref:glycosyltransferase n=1 Tax=Shimia ponticola TaxID=2582893 RepID=UPI0011BF30D0|nr:glycosyltransferase [Shimia ponticola]